ncbi:unnamed protein product [Arctogadus glacialis]
MNVNMWLMVHRAEASEQRTRVSLVGGPGAGHRVEDVRSQGLSHSAESQGDAERCCNLLRSGLLQSAMIGMGGLSSEEQGGVAGLLQPFALALFS